MKLFTLLSALFLSCYASFGATDITTATITGHWTVTGSPYRIHNNVTVPAGGSLIIDPGVDIQFMGNCIFKVTGYIKAVGTGSDPILFHANDTTGFSDLTVYNGGWYGLVVEYQATPDSSVVDYCKFYDVKRGSMGIYRPIHFKNSEVYHCISTGGLFMINNYNGTVYMSECDIHDNFSTSHPTAFTSNILYIKHTASWGSRMPASVNISNTRIHDNTSTATLFATYANLTLRNNSFYGNHTDDEGVLELRFEDTVDLYNNKIYGNVMNGSAALHCLCSDVDITNNYICNNNDIMAGCSATQGGGGIHLSSNGLTGTLRYTVRNNIIANNTCIQTGAGIYMYHTGAVITNNAFVGNMTMTEGAAIGIDNTWNTTVIKNNIFYHNRTSGIPSEMSISSYEGGHYYFAHNFLERTIRNEFKSWVTLDLLGDTTNYIGTDPFFINPTLHLGDSSNALTADFHVTNTSPCINAGDSSRAECYTTDYSGNNRIMGGRIDIGPYECEGCASVAGVYIPSATTSFDVYPNPATGLITIELPKVTGTITIYDITGRGVQLLPVTSPLITADLTDMPKGIYLITWNDGQMPVSRKITLQ